MICLLVEKVTLRIYEIFGTDDVGMLEGGNHIAVLETAVKYGNGHALALVADIMKALSEQHRNLFVAVAIRFCLDTVPGVEGVMGLGLYHPGDTVWGDPYLLCLPDTVEGCQTLEQGGVVRTYQYCIVPSTGTDDGVFR